MHVFISSGSFCKRIETLAHICNEGVVVFENISCIINENFNRITGGVYCLRIDVFVYVTFSELKNIHTLLLRKTADCRGTDFILNTDNF